MHILHGINGLSNHLLRPISRPSLVLSLRFLKMKHWKLVFHFLNIALVLGAENKTNVEADKQERLGLLASSLGVAPVPGYGQQQEQSGGLVSGGPGGSYGNNDAEKIPIIGGAPIPDVPVPGNCQCVPIAHCAKPAPGPSYGGGGSVPVISDPGYGGGSAPVISDPGYGNKEPVIDPGYGGNKEPVVVDPGYGGIKEPVGPAYGGDGGVSGPGYGNGGDAPVVGPGPGYGGGGIKEPVGPGYGGQGDEYPATNPEKDGAGVIDIRIVNRPPGPVQCLDGQTFCCGADIIGSDYTGGGGGYVPPGAGGYGTCGTRNILNVPGWVPEYGQAKFGAYPWMSVILGKGNNYIGAGALLNSNFVLTAAHKVQAWKPGTYMKVRFGEWNAKDDDEPYKNIEVDVEYVEVHPQFNPENLFNDVALVKLAKPVDVNAYPHIRPACLPKEPANYVGKRCWVSGFGKDAFGTGKHSYIMREVDLPIVDPYVCQDSLRKTRLGKKFELNKYSFLCAGGEEGKDACTGDGGSPLVCEHNGVWNVVGLVAWGIGCGDYAVPGAYVNLQTYLPWIEDRVNGIAPIQGGGY